ncbi:MAG TPA: gephyrin-like molybdotransferase Glp [Bacteroidales bacterium]|jgi:molybdopterin molybdotransferase
MITFEEATALVTGAAHPLSVETCGLSECLGRVLAADVFADMDMPPFDKSAVDGFACRRQDMSNPLRIIETIAAGKVPVAKIGTNECSRIMTGAMLPQGADIVLMVENTETTGEFARFTGKQSAINICFIAEDIHKDDKVLSAGIRIKPQHVAVLASVGCHSPVVCRKPIIGVISTGNELVEPEEQALAGQIRNSNGWQLMAQVQKAGCNAHYFGIADDSPEGTHAKIASAEAKCDIILLTGGVSMGDYDYVPGVIAEAGFTTLFHNIAVQPGKPTIFAVKDHTYLFGLPGNPVSAFVQFELIIRLLIDKITGCTDPQPMLRLPLGQDYKRRKSDRKSFLPVKIKFNEVFPVDYHGSAHIHAYVEADGIIAVNIGETEIQKGALVDVRQL